MATKRDRQRAREQAARRVRAAKIAGIALVIVAAALVAWRFTGSEGTSAGDGYAFTDVAIEQIPPDDDSLDGGWRVVFDARWGGEDDPPSQALPCTATATGAGGEEVFESEFGLYIGSGETTATAVPALIEVNDVESVPMDADVDCGTSGYEVGSIAVVRGWAVTFGAEWRGEGDPPIETCFVRLVDEDDDEDPFEERTLVMSARRLDEGGFREVFTAEEFRTPPERAVVSCEEIDEGEDIIID